MKHLADRLVKSLRLETGVDRLAADLLKTPAENHANKAVPMVERFVFDAANEQTITDAINAAGFSFVRQTFRLPLESFWVECGCYGFLVSGGTVWLFVDAPKFRSVFAYASISIENLRKNLGDLIDMNLLHPDVGVEEMVPVAANAFANFVGMCALINSPRSATVERVTRKEMRSHEQKVFAMRRAQRGAPVYSFNRVTINRPETSLQRGEVVNCGPQTSKRGHYVIGHWRLLDGKAEPYWVWIESHPRGDETLGFVAHERHLKIEPGSFGSRRGFELPTFPGASGQRIKAQRAG